MNQDADLTALADLSALQAIPTDVLSLVLDFVRTPCLSQRLFDGKDHGPNFTAHSNVCFVHRWCSNNNCVPGGSFWTCRRCRNLICPACPRGSCCAEEEKSDRFLKRIRCVPTPR